MTAVTLVRPVAGTAKTWQRRALGLAAALDRYRGLCVGLMMLCLLPTVVIEDYSHPLVNDEIYTVHIAQAPTLGQMMSLAHEIDLHPPLHYVAERMALAVPGPRWFTARLPSLLGVVTATLCLFVFAARRWGNLFGMVAVGAFWWSPWFLDFAWNDRPYMLWLAFLCAVLLAWDSAVQRHRNRWMVLLVFVLATAMVMTHYLGVACLLPLAGAEVYRARQRGRTDWLLLLALVLPMGYGVSSYYQLSHMAANVFPESRQASLGMLVSMYGQMTQNILVIAGICIAAAMVLVGRTRLLTLLSLRDADRSTEVEEVDVAERSVLLALIGLLLVPALLLFVAMGLHMQFWLRYALAAIPAWAVLVTMLIERRVPASRLVAVLLVLATIGYMVSRAVGEADPPGTGPAMVGGRPLLELEGLDPTLPIVAASPMTFVEMSDREPVKIAQRVYYLTDVAAAMQYAHYTLFENEEKIRRLLQLPSKTEPLQPFLAEHPRFYLVGTYSDPEIWLLRKLEGDGLKLDYLGKFRSSYESDDLYMVTR